MPTILDWLHIEKPIQCDGVSLLPIILKGYVPANWRTEAHWEYDFRDIPHGETKEFELALTHHQCSLNVIRSKRYKYVHFTHLAPLFFDLEQDPEELKNQVNKKD